jgi:hypothetical protein
MTNPANFVTELYRAGNEAGKLTPFEAKRLLERAAAAIRDMLSAVPETGLLEDIDDRLSLIEGFAKDIVGLPPQLLAHVLLDAADLIRALRIVLDDEVDRIVCKSGPEGQHD